MAAAARRGQAALRMLPGPPKWEQRRRFPRDSTQPLLLPEVGAARAPGPRTAPEKEPPAAADLAIQPGPCRQIRLMKQEIRIRPLERQGEQGPRLFLPTHPELFQASGRSSLGRFLRAGKLLRSPT